MGVSPFQRPSLEELKDLMAVPLYVDRYGRSHYPILGGAPDEDEDENDPDDDDDDDSDDEDQDDESDEKDDKPRPEKKDRSSLKDLRDENARRRRREKELRARAEAAEAKVTAFEEKGKSDLEKEADKSESWKTRAEKSERRERDLALRNAFLMDNTHRWHDTRAALKLLDLDDVEIDEDGEVTGMSEAIEKLAEDSPWLIKSENRDDDEDEQDRSRTGDPTRRKRKNPKTPQREKLLSAYPALSNR